MRLESGYRQQPGCCAVCKSADSTRTIIDLELHDPGVLHRYARLYLCGDCALQIGQMAAEQMGRAIVSADFKQKYLELDAECDGVIDRLHKAEQTIAMFTQAMRSVEDQTVSQA